MTRKRIQQILLYYHKFCGPNGPPMDIKKCAEVIHTALIYCAETMDPSPLSAETVHKVLEKCGFKLMPLPESPTGVTVT